MHPTLAAPWTLRGPRRTRDTRQTLSCQGKQSSSYRTLYFPSAPQHQVALFCTALTFTVGMLYVPAKENRVEQLPHIEVAAKERTIPLSYYKDFHGNYQYIQFGMVPLMLAKNASVRSTKVGCLPVFAS